jgi:hypothetical protein
LASEIVAGMAMEKQTARVLCSIFAILYKSKTTSECPQ